MKHASIGMHEFDMITRRKRIVILVLVVGMLAVACQHSSSQERVYDMSPIDTTGGSIISSCNPELETDSVTDIQSEPKSGSQSFTLLVDDNFLIVDHGKSSVNVYRAVPGETTTTWMGNDKWEYAPVLIDWCVGKTIGSDEFRHVGEGDDETFSTITRELALENIGSVHEISLSEIASLDAFPQSYCDWSSGETVLAWSYSLEGYPWEYYDGVEWFIMPTDIEKVEYIMMTPYLDGIPLGSGRTTADFPAYEWEGVIGLAGAGSFPSWGLSYMNSERQYLQLTSFDCEIVQTILKDQAVIPAKDCLDSLEVAFSYDDRQVSGKTIEVYCMELRYLIADEFPLQIEDGVQEYVLIPIWTAHAKIYDDSSVSIGTTSINAITGEPLFSETVGPDDPRYYSAMGVGT